MDLFGRHETHTLMFIKLLAAIYVTVPTVLTITLFTYDYILGAMAITMLTIYFTYAFTH